MTNVKRAVLTAVAVVVPVLFVGCSQPVAPTGPTLSGGNATSTEKSDGKGADRSPKEVPFKGRWEGAIAGRTVRPGLLVLSFEGTGNASHLGRFTVEIQIDLNTTPDRRLTGTYVFTAANGDTLTATVTGSSPLAPAGVPQISTESATITGGTGRFANASGSFAAERVVDLATGSITGSFEGTISSPGASKH